MTRGACRFPKDRDSLRISPKILDVVAHPLQSYDHDDDDQEDEDDLNVNDDDEDERDEGKPQG